MGELPDRLTPHARADSLAGWAQDEPGRHVLLVKPAASPLEGKVNRSLVAFLSKRLNVPKKAIPLRQGKRSRIKRLRVATREDAEIHARFQPGGTAT